MSTDANLTALQADARTDTTDKTVFKILLAISFCHLLNDTVQSLIPAIYPLLKNTFHLDLGQVGLIALTSQVTASLLQPLVGLYTDRRPQPYSLAVGMGITLSHRVLPEWRPVDSTDWRNRFFRSVATLALPWAHCLRRSSSPKGNPASRGFRSWLCLASSCSSTLDRGPGSTSPISRNRFPLRKPASRPWRLRCGIRFYPPKKSPYVSRSWLL